MFVFFDDNDGGYYKFITIIIARKIVLQSVPKVILRTPTRFGGSFSWDGENHLPSHPSSLHGHTRPLPTFSLIKSTLNNLLYFRVDLSPFCKSNNPLQILALGDETNTCISRPPDPSSDVSYDLSGSVEVSDGSSHSFDICFVSHNSHICAFGMQDLLI